MFLGLTQLVFYNWFMRSQFNLNNFLLQQVLIVDGINRNIYDKYREARYANKQKDSNNDLIINLHEFTSYVVWQMNIGIGVERVQRLPVLVATAGKD